MTDVTVFGAGAFGTALAISLARDGKQVSIISRDRAHSNAMTHDRENKRRLPGFAFPKTLTVALNDDSLADICLMAVPTQSLGEVVREHRSALAGRHLVACCKGVDLTTGLGPTGVIAQECPSAIPAAISGPSFAVDIAAGLPTALTLAAETDRIVQSLQTALATQNIRLYSTTDTRGVELGGALKNVVAIAAGIAIGAGLGESARAALMTRGYAEMARFARHYGALSETLSGLSGFGDLVLTCTSTKSRNFSHGVLLGRGAAIEPGITVEGVKTSIAISGIAASAGIDMPITSTVASLLNNSISVEDAIKALMTRPLKKE